MSLPVPIHYSSLTQAQAASLESVAPQLRHAWERQHLWRTETEARISILDDVHFPTKASKWWQCNREQVVFLREAYRLSLEMQRNEVKIKKYVAAIEKEENELEQQLIKIDLDECHFNQAECTLAMADRVREIMMWEKLKSELNDGSFDTDNVNTHQLVSYTQQFCIRAANTSPTMTAGELDNLRGQLLASIRVCREQGVLDEVFKQLPPQTAAIVEQLFNPTVTPRIESSSCDYAKH